jgi:hypothetical protein
MGREIFVTVDAQGNTVIETKGFSGSDCLKATMELEKALGAKTSDRKTREYTTTTDTAQKQRTGR